MPPLSSPPTTGLARRILGHIPDFMRDRMGFLTRSMRDHGDLVPLRFGPTRAFLVAHPDLIRTVLVDEVASYDKGTAGYREVRRILHDGLFTSEGPLWRRQRRLYQPAFRRERLRELAAGMTRAAVELAASLAERAGQEIDIDAEMMQVTLRIVGEALLGADLRSDAGPVSESLTEILDQLRWRMLRPTPYWIPTPANRRMLRAVGSLDHIVRRTITARRAAAAAQESDLLALMMAARDEETGGGGMSDAQLRDECITILLAGHETTAVALVWTLHLLDRHPDAAARVRAELGVLGGRPPGFDDLPRLPYLRMVLQESMRLYPPLWLFSRRAVTGGTLAGHAIPRGAMMMISPYVLHRNPRVWRDPETFRPERFQPGAEEHDDKLAYLPFGAGPRFCVGNHFGMTESMILLGAILQAVVLHREATDEVAPASSVTLRPRDGLRMRVSLA